MYDLIIAGAGPAGSAAARAAAMMGLNALILEKDVFPRYKPCGGALSDRAVSLLGFPLPKSLCERTITGARVHFRDKVLERHKGYSLTTLVTRSSFDQFLLQKAEDSGAIHVTAKVLDYRESDDSISVLTNKGIHRARFLVISSGCQDHLKNKILGQVAKDSMGVCMVTEIEEDDRIIEERLNSSLDIHFGVADMGYGWIFPHRGYYSVGIGGLASRHMRARRIMMEFLKANGFPLNQRLHGHLIPQGGSREMVARRRVLLTGDSAGFVDAFSGEGIYYALRSGQIAAQAIGEAHASKVAETYQSRCKKEIGEELGYALQFSKMMHSHPNIFLRILASQDDVLDRYLEIATAKGSYKGFLRWLVPRLPISILRSFKDIFQNKSL
ncbi:MAG: geranylgeranyl reductase family protein [Methanothrix sp.]|nr:geranylgeranyl reductase family protein [Methanothrix sp.]